MDEVIGIAILTRTKPQELIVLCRKDSGGTFLQKIPAYAPGDSKPAEHAWQYQIAGDVLNITPSLHIRYQLPPDETWITRFHNGVNWSVRFKWAETTDPETVWEEAKRANANIEITHGL